MHLVDTDFSMVESEMQDCSADGDGGAVYGEENVSIWIYDSTLQRNAAIGDGGAIYLGGGDTFIDSDTWITANTAEGFGGGLYLRNMSGTIRADVTFNEAENSGGIYLFSTFGATDSELTLNAGARLDHNHADVAGGGIRGFDANLTLSGEVQIVDNDAGEWGGGLALFGVVLDVGAATTDDVQVSGNAAPLGAGMEAALATIDVSGALFADNVATMNGGGILLEYQSTGSLINTRFVRNTANRGAALLVSASTLDADADYNACDVSSLPTDSYCSEFAANTANTNGVVQVRDGSTVEIVQTAIRLNQASNKGGAVHLVDDASSVTLRNVLVTGDQTPAEAAVLASAGTLNIHSSTFADNGAPVEFGPGASGLFHRSMSGTTRATSSPALRSAIATSRRPPRAYRPVPGTCRTIRCSTRRIRAPNIACSLDRRPSTHAASARPGTSTARPARSGPGTIAVRLKINNRFQSVARSRWRFQASITRFPRVKPEDGLRVRSIWPSTSAMRSVRSAALCSRATRCSAITSRATASASPLTAMSWRFSCMRPPK